MKNNSKKYRLIREYPGSPKLNYILEPIKNNKQEYYINNMFINPEDHPEYWEEVVEKDYEILSFVNNGKANGVKGFVVPLQEDGLYYAKGYPKSENDYDESLEGCLKESFLDIHSVKRLSDGEVFTVGDLVITKGSKQSSARSITSIGFETLGKMHENLYIYRDGSFSTINMYEKIKQPLLTTEDGVDVFEDSDAWSINKKTFRFCSKGHKGFYKGFIPNADYLYFSTEEKAEEYIKLNSIRYSLKDIKEAFGESRTLSFKSIFNKLKQ